MTRTHARTHARAHAHAHAQVRTGQNSPCSRTLLVLRHYIGLQMSPCGLLHVKCQLKLAEQSPRVMWRDVKQSSDLSGFELRRPRTLRPTTLPASPRTRSRIQPVPPFLSVLCIRLLLFKCLIYIQILDSVDITWARPMIHSRNGILRFTDRTGKQQYLFIYLFATVQQTSTNPAIRPH